MPIKYVLLENSLTPDPDDFIARVQSVGTVVQDEIIERMVQRGSTITRADIVGVLEDFYAVIEDLLLEGQNANTPIANFSTSIKGTFRGVTDSFDPNRHRLNAVLTAGSRLRRTLRERGRVVKQESVKAMPTLLDYTDINTGKRNGPLTPGGLGKIEGHHLKFNPNDSAQGIFFIAEEGTETQVSVIGQNKPGGLMFLVPDSLASGRYRLEVRATFRKTTELRIGRLDAVLTVA